jgi:tryptophan halogenase
MVKDGIDPALPAEFNRLSAMQYERIRDFLILHYVANSREGEPFWDYLRHMAIPDSLAHKLSLFRSRGSLSLYQYGLFARDSWLAVLLGQGITPKAYDRTADTFDLTMVGDRLDAFADRIAGNVASMPQHEAFIANYCKGRP